MNYELIRSKRKTLAVEVSDGGRITVRAPLHASEKAINAFLESNSEWLSRAISKSVQRQKLAAEYEIPPEDIEKTIAEAKKYLPERTAFWSSITGLYPEYIKITSASKRFGSCNGKNGICYSWRLMAYPENVIDYVILHELAHIKHKNHSRAFYELIKEFMPDYKSRERILKHKGE